jgi:hypothetical protein
MVMLVLPRYRSRSEVSSAYSSGTPPVIRLLYRSRCCSEVSSDSAGGSLPAEQSGEG